MQSSIHMEANLLSRLERIPINRRLLAIVALLAWCWVMEAFDLGIIGQVLLVLKKMWTLEPSTVGLLGICSTAGVVIGTASAGFLTDRFGRRKVLLCGVFVFTFFTLIGALYTNISWIVTMRFLGGLGAGSVFPLPYLMISEIAPAKHRGLMVCICNAILTAAYFLPTAAGSWAIKNFEMEMAWRVPFIIGGIPIVTLFFLYKWLPESPRWLMKRGRHQEVVTLVESLEKSANVEHDPDYIDPAVLQRVQQTARMEKQSKALNWKSIVTPPLLSRSIVAWTLYTSGLITWYVIMVYVPTILSTYGFDISLAVIMTGYMMILGGIGSIVVGPLTDRFGRKPICTLYIGVTAACLALLGTGSLSQSMVLVAGALIAFLGVGILPVLKVYVAEQYPTELRGVGTGFGEATARVFGGVLATYYFAFFMSLGGISTVLYFMSIAFALAIVMMLLWGKETARKTVEEASSTDQTPAEEPAAALRS